MLGTVETNGLMPCGRKNCTECESCEYDFPLDNLFLNLKKKKMRDFGLMPVGDNPSTAQIIIPGAAMRHNVPPFGVPTQLSIPFKSNEHSSAENPYCNECKYFLKIQRPNKSTFNTRCSAETPRPGGSERVVKLNVYPDEKVKKPFWCPIIKEYLMKPVSDGIKVGDKTIYPARKESAMSDEQLRAWNRAKNERERKEKWLAAPGLTSWGEIEINKIYHLPPTCKKGRMDIKIKQKYVGSIQAVDIKTNQNVWFYKDDEEYKFMSLYK